MHAYRKDSGSRMKLKNINGTSDTTCVCGSWLKHWEKFSGQTVTYCGEKACLSKDVVGAHVQLADGSDRNWYIYPLCNKHNQATGTLEVSDNYKLVSANKSETCEKKSSSASYYSGSGGYAPRRY
jgi:hypothetical protein